MDRDLGIAANSSDPEENDNIKSLLDVFKIYSKTAEPSGQAGLHMGGLDLGMDLALNPLYVSFDSKENLVEKLMSPFPNASNSYSESL